ncbi:MAG: S8 family serine peptidase, partial [Anaerolineales bacterium]
MRKIRRFTQILIALTLIAGLLPPAVLTARPAPTRMSSSLAEMVAAESDQQVRVIVHKAGASDQVEGLVTRLDGQVLKDLSMINAIAALLPARSVTKLAASPAVARVSLDAPVISTGKPVGDPEPLSAIYSVLDRFDLPSYSNNDGTASWVSDWSEFGDDGSPLSGQIKVDHLNQIRFENQDFEDLESVQRSVDLSLAENAELSFSYGAFAEGDGNSYAIDVSSDGLSFITLDVIPITTLESGTRSYMLTGVTDFTDNFTVRFRLEQGFDGLTRYDDPEYVAFDNIKVQYTENIVLESQQENVYLESLGVQDVWAMGYTGAGIGVAVIDSGISVDQDLNNAARKSFNPNSHTVNDVYGHGTHVAGIIGGNGASSAGLYQGVAPDVNLYSLKISDENGMAYESDTVAAMQWVFDNKDLYNIRVLNLSIQSTIEQSYHDSALAAAAEILWFNGVVVVAATGNWYGGEFYPLNAAPGNDPFIITVGAVDDKGTNKVKDDRPATFSVWGYTLDGFIKPEIYAPGVNIISVLSKDSTWNVEYPERVITISGKPQYFRISGTSMATPMVAGAVALLLQAEPDLTPDQVKFRIMNTHIWAGSSPYLSVYNMLTTSTTQLANQEYIPHMLLAKMALIAYWASENGEENIDWENVDWDAVNWDAVDWDAVNWNAVNWNAVNWNAVNWNAVNWNAVNWNAVNWNAVNWNAVNWNAVN